MSPAGPVVVVANPTAGDGKAGRSIGRVDTILNDLGVDHEIRVSGSATELEAMARDAARAGAATVAVLGGDGSVNLAANGLFGTGSTLAVIPAGTGDDFAKGIGVGRLDAATRLLADPKTVDIDVIEVAAGAEVRRYVNIAGTGFDSAVEEVAAGMRRRLGARGHYALATVRTLGRFVPAAFRIEMDGRSLDV